MPIPSDVKKEDHPKLDKACKAFMEYGFANRIHIMEFLQQQKIVGSWWDPLSIHSNSYIPEIHHLAEIINTFNDTEISNKADDSSDKNTSFNANNSLNKNNPAKKNSPASNQKSSNKVSPSVNSSAINKNSPATTKSSPATTKSSLATNQSTVSNHNNSAPAKNNPSVTYFHSPNRPPADIAFVDCGPTPSMRTSNAPKQTPQNIAPKVINDANFFANNTNLHGILTHQLFQNTRQIPLNSKQSPTSSIATSIASSTSNKVYTMSTSNTTTNTGPKISVKKFASDPATNWGKLGESSETFNSQAQPSNTKILTVHSEKCLDLSSIISQLPPDVMNSKKIVFIEQNSNSQYQKKGQGNKSTIQIASPTLSANCIKVVPQRRLISKERKKNKPIPILPAETLPQMKQVSQPTLKKIMKPNFPVTSANSIKSLNAAKPNFTVAGMKSVMKTSPVETKLSPSNRSSAQNVSTNPTGIKLQQINTYDGRVFYQSGKTYVIKQSNAVKSSSGPSNSILKTATQVSNPISYTLKAVPSSSLVARPINVIPSSISPLTPSPSPSELSSSSSCETQAKQVTNSEDDIEKGLSIIKPSKNVKFDLMNLSFNEQKFLFIKTDVMGRSYLHKSQNLPYISNTKNNVTKYRQAMLDNLPYLNSKQIEQRIAHVKKLGEEYSKIMRITDDKVILQQKQLINALEDSVEQAKLLNINKGEENKKSKIDECLQIDDWENQGDMQQCSFCEKIKKPANYLPGFSKESSNESKYCQCYNFHCSRCNTFQGNLQRFKAHINYDEKVSPHICPECLRRFTSFDLLEKHIWMNCFHPMVKNWMLGCRICGIDGLTTMESLARHFLIMHTETGFACSECNKVFFSKKDCKIHQSGHRRRNQEKKAKDNQKQQNDYDKVSNPVEIIICKVGRCVIFKENFKDHLINHVGVEQQVFYKCPFCPFLKRDGQGVKELFRDHMFSTHNHILPKFMNFKILDEIRESLKINSNVEEVLPMIVNTRTIAQEAFEKGTQDEESMDGDSGMPMIIDVRSEAVDLNSASDASLMPKILEVKSIANDSLEKETDSMKRNSSTVFEISLCPERVSNAEIANGEVVVKDEKENPEGEKFLAHKENLVEDKSDKENSAKDSAINENSKESAKDNRAGEVKALIPTSALEDLKAKMSRTFKTLAKKMEATTMTLQECSKSLPKLKTFPEVLKFPKGDLSMEVKSEKEDESTRLDVNAILVDELNINSVQLPPLSRIPQHLLSTQPIVENEKIRRSKKRKLPCRIAFNGPINCEETIVEFKCHICNQIIDSSWPVLKSHFDFMHQDEYKICVLNPQLLKITSDYIEGGYKEVLAKKYKCDSSPRKKRRRTRFATKIAEKASLDQLAGLCVTAESVEDEDGTFKCKKCDLRCSEIGDLREHIAKSHRIKGRYLVCLECGENFVVAQSLQMHLKAFHAIEDPLTYLLQNTAFAPENLEDTEEEEEEVTIEANQCYVCMAVFEDKAAVDKHLRVHGMAFLHRKRIEAKKNLHSPQKKFKAAVLSEEEVRNVDADSSSEKLQEENKGESTEASAANSQESEVN